MATSSRGGLSRRLGTRDPSSVHVDRGVDDAALDGRGHVFGPRLHRDLGRGLARHVPGAGPAVGAASAAESAVARPQPLLRRPAPGDDRRRSPSSRPSLPCGDPPVPALDAGSQSGTPNIGKNRAVSRKKVSPLIRPPSISTTWTDHGRSVPSGRRLVLREARRAVDGHRQQPAALAADARSEAPGADVVVGLEPHLVRRHGPGRVLVEQRGQRVHVVPLECVHVAREDLAPPRVRASTRPLRSAPAGARASRGRAGARCSRRRPSSQADPRPRRRASEGRRAGSARHAAVAAAAGSRP